MLGNRNRLIQSHSHSGPNNQDDWNIDDSTTISGGGGGGGGNFGDPLLVDHSYIHDDLIDESRSVGGTQPQQGGGGSGGGSGSGTIALMLIRHILKNILMILKINLNHYFQVLI